MQRENSTEARWQDISNMLSLEDETNNTESMIAELAKLLEENNNSNNTNSLPEHSLMSNATLSSATPQMNVNELSFNEGKLHWTSQHSDILCVEKAFSLYFTLHG